MNKNIIDFYLAASNIKNTIRTGWKDVNIPNEYIESVADHFCGCVILTLGVCSEKDYKELDFNKIVKMLLVKELHKVITNEMSIIKKEDKKKANEDAIRNILEPLKIRDELFKLYIEACELKTDEAKFVQKISKLESDLQAKKYELEGHFTLDAAKKDVSNYPEDLKEEILPQLKNASDGWILFDRKYYDEDEDFISLSKDIQNIKPIK